MSRAIANRFPHRITPLPWLSKKSGLTLVKREGPRALTLQGIRFVARVGLGSLNFSKKMSELKRHFAGFCGQ